MHIAFNFTSTCFYYVVLHNTKAQPVFIHKDKVNLPANHTVPQLTSWFENELNALLVRFTPISIAYKISIANVRYTTIEHVYYGQGILNLLCHKHNIPTSYLSAQSLVPKRYGLAKGTNLYQYIDGLLGQNPPYWDNKMRDTALIALDLLP